MWTKETISARKSSEVIMQNQFFGDRHDFYKYFFLKEITKDYSLGIHWCLVPDEGGKAGQTLLTDKEKNKDQDLYKILTNTTGQNVENIEPYFSKHLRHEIAFFSEPHVDYSNDFLYEQEAVNCLSYQDIIYFDPDNGIEVPSTNNKNKYKYVSYRLLQRFWQMEKSLIIYQHADHQKDSLEEKIRILYNLIGKKANVITVKKGQVTYICMIQGDKHYIMKDELVEFKKNKEYKIENWKGTGDIC
jgi:hypothetical protein